MFKNAALAATAALALGAAPAASAWKVSFFEDGRTDCTGSAVTGFGSGSGCMAIADYNRSFSVACASDESSSVWTYRLFDGTTCNGNVTDTYSGDDSTSCDGGFKVDCGAQACYSGKATVQLEGGATVPMSQLNPGDRVLSADASGNLFYDKVFRVTHWDQESTGSFVKLTTESGNALELTSDHYVHVGGLEHANLKLASEVAAGDELFVVGADGSVTVSTVTEAGKTSGQGLFNVHTLSSRVVVNGVVSSHFSKESSWGSSNGAAPLWYKLVDAAAAVFGAENARLD
jgi:hypothetical protein